MSLVERALALDRLAIATLVTTFEDQRPAARAQRAEILAELGSHPERRAGHFLGITGTPGSGKSSLVNALSGRLLQDPALRVAVLAVDPSSHISGGALLGDRTRIRLEPEKLARFFFRSQASQTELGGLSPASFQVCRLLHLLFDLVFIETVGVGQSEVDIRFLADKVYLVMTPLGGDEVQFLKAGIMEIPDVVLLNKSDVGQAARKSYYSLRNSLALARPFDADQVEIVRTSAITGMGLDSVALGMAEIATGEAPTLSAKERYFFAKWVRYEWGRRGAAHLRDELGGAEFVERAGGFDPAQAKFSESFRGALRLEQGRA